MNAGAAWPTNNTGARATPQRPQDTLLAQNLQAKVDPRTSPKQPADPTIFREQARPSASGDTSSMYACGCGYVCLHFVLFVLDHRNSVPIVPDGNRVVFLVDVNLRVRVRVRVR